MDTILQKDKPKRGLNKVMLAGLLIGAILVGAGVFVIWKLQPSMEEQKQAALEGAVREGSPDFETLTKRIVAETDEDNTMQSPIGLGSIMMSIGGKIRNNSDRVVTGLELRVSVLDTFDKVIKDKTLIVVPTQQAKLEPKGEMSVVVRVDGFKPEDDRARIRWKVTAIKVE